MALRCFDVVRSRTRKEIFVIYQSDFLEYFTTRLVIPLVPERSYGDSPVLRLTPKLRLDDESYVLATHLCFSARTADLEPTGSSLDSEHDAIRDAFDFLTTGF